MSSEQPGATMGLDELRRRINEIDDQLVELIAERKNLSREVARVKRVTGRATRDYGREREVIVGARAKAESLGVSPETVMRDWKMAKAWLLRELRSPEGA